MTSQKSLNPFLESTKRELNLSTFLCNLHEAAQEFDRELVIVVLTINRQYAT
jgi:hypothetical protein